jgi:hypothetical protein
VLHYNQLQETFCFANQNHEELDESRTNKKLDSYSDGDDLIVATCSFSKAIAKAIQKIYVMQK